MLSLAHPDPHTALRRGRIWRRTAAFHRSLAVVVAVALTACSGSPHAQRPTSAAAPSQATTPGPASPSPAPRAAGTVSAATPPGTAGRTATPAGGRLPPAGATGYVSLEAGSGEDNYVDGPPDVAAFHFPSGIAVAPDGSLYVSDLENHRIRKILPGGYVTTFAGSGPYGTEDSGFQDGPSDRARFNQPLGVALDRAGNLYVADQNNNRIRKVAPDGSVSTLAGRDESGSTDGPRSRALLSFPQAVAVDGAGNVFTIGGSQLRKITPAGDVSTVPIKGAANGIASDAAGTLYLSMDPGQIHKIAPNGSDTLLAGAARGGYLDGPGAQAQFNHPEGLALDAEGNVYVADNGNNRIRRISPDGTVSTVAGVGGRFSSDREGPAAGVYLGDPTGLAIDAGGTLYITDLDLVLKLTAAKPVPSRVQVPARPATPAPALTAKVNKYFVGAGSEFGSFLDGKALDAEFASPSGLARDAAGNLYVGDTGNHRVRKVAPDGTVSTLAGSEETGAADGAGAAATFDLPFGVAVDAGGTVYVADMGNHRIRAIAPDGTVRTVAGSGSTDRNKGGFADGPGQTAKFDGPAGLAVDAAGNLYVADSVNNRIRKIAPGGTVSTFAGSARKGAADGTGAAAQFDGPMGVAVDANGVVYVADSGNNRIRRVTPGGVVTTIAGTVRNPGKPDPEDGAFGDGPQGANWFDTPVGVAVDKAGNVFVTDSKNARLRRVAANGTVTTISDYAPGFLISQPTGIVIDPQGKIYLTTTKEHKIIEVTLQ